MLLCLIMSTHTHKIKLLCISIVVTILGIHVMHIIHVSGYWRPLYKITMGHRIGKL
jgi:hypothetical protein